MSTGLLSLHDVVDVVTVCDDGRVGKRCLGTGSHFDDSGTVRSVFTRHDGITVGADLRKADCERRTWTVDANVDRDNPLPSLTDLDWRGERSSDVYMYPTRTNLISKSILSLLSVPTSSSVATTSSHSMRVINASHRQSSSDINSAGMGGVTQNRCGYQNCHVVCDIRPRQ